MTTSRAHKQQANTTVATYEGDSAPIWQFVNEVLTARKRHNRKRDRKMAFELREGQGSAFENPDRDKGEDYPDFKGKIKLSAEIVAMAAKNGNVVGIAAWKKMTKSGEPMLSFALNRPFVPQRQGRRGNDQEVEEKRV